MVLWSLAILLFSLTSEKAAAQGCPAVASGANITYPNTYFPGNVATVAAGSTSISLGASVYGNTQIKGGDILLVIQMQGAEINSTNTNSYGDGTGTGRGYLNNGLFLAGTMEFATAANTVPLTGGTLNLQKALVHSYQSSAYVNGGDGQYTFQVLRVPLYYDIKMANTITAPAWTGAAGGMMVIAATDDVNLNGQIIDASGKGFRGGGGTPQNGAGSGANTDYVTLGAAGANGSKGEGIAGTPMFINNNYASLITNANEGYPNGTSARGAPGNAGGGASDGDPAHNLQNTGGGGGSNGGSGGMGGNSHTTNLPYGGLPGAIFAQAAENRLVMGGGGGAGSDHNSSGTPGNGLASSGSAGGGIIMIISQNTVTGPATVKANGANANITVNNDGGGGGGAGGSILIYAASFQLSNITAQANGGNGGTDESSGSGNFFGPGGGGGGGVIYANTALNAASSVTGGSAGTTSAGSTNYGATAGSAGVLNIQGAASFATFPVMCTVLSASYTDVTARPAHNVINIGWTMANESTTTGYAVERSADGTNFSAIASVPYNENGDVNDEYLYTDATGYTLGGILYYRIRENETGGQIIYSKIVSVRPGASSVSSGADLTVFPNPSKDAANVSFTMTTSANVSLRLFDVRGSQRWEQQVQAGAGQNTVKIDKIASLPDGIYLLQWFDGLNPRMAKLLVRH